MKYNFLIMLFFPVCLFAQDCKLVRETDPYTKDTRLSSGIISFTGASLSIDADSKEIDFFFTVNDKCFTDASTVFVFFEGTKAKMTYRNAGSMNCEGSFHFNFRNNGSTPTLLQRLSTQKVVQFIFKGNDKKDAVVSLSAEEQKIFMEAASCVIKESKTLIKQ